MGRIEGGRDYLSAMAQLTQYCLGQDGFQEFQLDVFLKKSGLRSLFAMDKFYECHRTITFLVIYFKNIRNCDRLYI